MAKIPKGTIVVVKGLVNAKAHNGKQGQIEDYVEERGRFMVELDEVSTALHHFVGLSCCQHFVVVHESVNFPLCISDL